MVAETKKILDPKIKADGDLRARAGVRRPLEAVNLEFENPISADEARDILREAPGVSVIDKREAGGYATPIEARWASTTPMCQPHPRGRDGRERPLDVGGVGQPPQGRGAQHGADPRDADRAQPGRAEGGLSRLVPPRANGGGSPATSGEKVPRCPS